MKTLSTPESHETGEQVEQPNGNSNHQLTAEKLISGIDEDL